MSNIDFNILLDVVIGVHGYEVSIFGELIYNHPNRVILAGSQWQTHNEVHTNVIPLLIWNTQRLQQSSGLHIIGLDLSTSVTF
jgi:hypothetical protein